MAIELKVPSIGESVTEVEIGDWRKAKGDRVEKDETVVVLESEKATVEVPAPAAGILKEVLKQKGEAVLVGDTIAFLEENGQAPEPPSLRGADVKADPPEPESHPRVMPAAQRALAEHGLRPEEVQATGPGGRLLKEDVERHVKARESARAEKPPAPPPPPAREEKARPAPTPAALSAPHEDREEDIVPMTRLRRTVAERLVEAQRNAALLTTFNEIDMSAVMSLRKDFGEAFLAKYKAKLGFMSFFVKACVDALKLVPQINAEIRGNNIVYKNYYDIGIAVGGGKGLVVPILPNAHRLSFAEVELAINDLAKRAKENQIKLEELQGGTFTISNGGVYGSLLSTPILNPPQSGILGMHTIQERPMALNGQVVIRPMMYIALTYDHRIVDGREAVTFLKRIKDVIENPTRLVLEI